MRYRITLLVLVVGSLTVSLRSQATVAKLDAATIYERAVKSVVLVMCSKSDGSVSQGSGVVLRKDGVIATNFHVCGDAVGGRVKLNNGDIYDDVSILDSDERKDVCILKIKAMNIPALTMSDSDQLKIGSNVYAIGAPLGLEGSITSGIISSIRPVNEMFSWADGFRIFQISVSVTHGSSGCPLVNEFGEVVGLVFAGRQEGQNLNAAIPINYVSPLVNSSKEARALKQLGNVETRNTSYSSQPPKKDSIEDLAGVYVGQWASDRYNVSGNLAMTLNFANGVPRITAVFTGSEYLNQDELEGTFTPMGAGVWKMDYVGKKSKIKGTGLFKNGRFVGDYKFKKFIWTDVGRWLLDRSR
jgi:S1-C subfamily serine protease